MVQFSCVIRSVGNVFLTGAFIYGSVWSIDKLINKYSKNPNEKSSTEDNEKYELKYMDEYNELKKTYKSSDNENYDSIKIHEVTPNGDVIMYYDNTSESFAYYCNDKTISYKYLETVARLYVITNKCPEFYLDMNEELNKNNPEDTTTNTLVGKQVNTIFATLKSYNKTNSKNNIIKNNANRFSYRGNLNEGKKLFINVNASPVSDTVSPPSAPSKKRVMSFSEFKKLQPHVNDSMPNNNDEEVETGNVRSKTKNTPQNTPHNTPQNTPELNPTPGKIVTEKIDVCNESDDTSSESSSSSDHSPTFIRRDVVNEITITEREMSQMIKDPSD